MQKINKNTAKSKYSNYGSYKYAKDSNNVKFFVSNKKKISSPTYRGAFPKPVRYSLNDMGVVNARYNYQKGLKMEASAKNKYIVYGNTNSKVNASFQKTNFNVNESNRNFLSATKNISNPSFNGNAVKKLKPKPKINKQPTKKTNIHVVRGNKQNKSILQTPTLSPVFISFAKICTVIVCFVAIVSFVRIGLTSTSITNGISSANLSKQIESELVTKNSLEVQNSTIGNSSKIRESAEKLGMITPTTIETIKLDKDIVAKDDNGNVSLVESLKRVADSTK